MTKKHQTEIQDQVTTPESEEFSPREELLARIAKHVVRDSYTYESLHELKLLISNKMSQELTHGEVKQVDKLVKEFKLLTAAQ